MQRSLLINHHLIKIFVNNWRGMCFYEPLILVFFMFFFSADYHLISKKCVYIISLIGCLLPFYFMYSAREHVVSLVSEVTSQMRATSPRGSPAVPRTRPATTAAAAGSPDDSATQHLAPPSLSISPSPRVSAPGLNSARSGSSAGGSWIGGPGAAAAAAASAAISSSPSTAVGTSRASATAGPTTTSAPTRSPVLSPSTSSSQLLGAAGVRPSATTAPAAGDVPDVPPAKMRSLLAEAPMRSLVAEPPVRAPVDEHVPIFSKPLPAIPPRNPTLSLSSPAPASEPQPSKGIPIAAAAAAAAAIAVAANLQGSNGGGGNTPTGTSAAAARAVAPGPIKWTKQRVCALLVLFSFFF